MAKKIMVVEDDPMNAKFFELTLKRRGKFDVIVTEDVDQILSLIRNGEIDMIVMDVSLCNSFYKGERVDGITLSRLIKQNQSSRDVPILLATAHAMKGEQEEFLQESGADGYVSKPVIDPDRFITKVNDLIG
ncbi:MAG: response regulator [Deltaproteobacteria bacterium]|nr:response regulator [Deltaproteobacteria bacterium]MBW2120461.1 response regulator [Deltaproteobacteria bacterium]